MAERSIALVERCRPLNAVREQRRVVDALLSGREEMPRFDYAPSGGLNMVRAALDQVALRAETACGWGQLYADRARELALEAELAEQVGLPGFAAAAAVRFPVAQGADGRVALGWAHAWVHEPDGPEDPDSAVESSDTAHPNSLISALTRAVGEQRLPFRVVVHADLISAAATGDGVIVVRSGARLRRAEVERIVRHEIEGHALPRARAKLESSGLFALGTAGGTDDEEGRALLIEQRAGVSSAARRAELARRHLGALAVRRGADWMETLRLLRGLGASVEQAVAIATRVQRGGGLAREIVYLTALARVTRVFAADRHAERWLERGRVAVDAIPTLRLLGEPPDLVNARAA